MNIDIKTVILIIGISHLMQALVFYYQYKVTKNLRGPGWWLTWSVAEIVGFILMLLRGIPSFLPFVIVSQNPIIFSGAIFIYIGIIKFFGRKVNWKLIIAFFTSYVLLHLFFFFIIDNIYLRTLNLNLFITISAFFTVLSIYNNKTKAIAISANFNTTLFIIHGCIFAYRTVTIALDNQYIDMFSPTFFNGLQFFDVLVIGLLWTFGFIIMLNQKLNAEISEAKTHFEQIFHTNPDAALITRFSDGKIIDCNDSYTTIFGYTKKEILGKTTHDINIWENPADRNEIIKVIQENGFCENMELLFQRKNGEIITGLLSARIITLLEIPHIISVTRDITERKLTEKVINSKNDELHKLNAEKDKFFSIIAHDLKSPLSAIVTFSELLTNKIKENDTLGIKKYTNAIMELSNKGVNLLMNLLEWSRSQTGRMVFNPIAFDMVNQIDEIIHLLESTAEQKSIVIIKDLPPSMITFADKDMISTILRNLISNAIKFTSSGGKITVSAKIQQNGLTVKISDTGVGIPKSSFEKLFRIDENYSTKGTLNEVGTGLGLILCKEFTEKHGGKIWVESEEGQGSDFYFTIPDNAES